MDAQVLDAFERIDRALALVARPADREAAKMGLAWLVARELSRDNKEESCRCTQG